ncbi:MAG: AAA family ATPase [Candidatus Hodarchaeales archaeon]|jgi:AAA family ATPase
METKQAAFLSTSKSKDAPNARFVLLKPVGYSLRPVEGTGAEETPTLTTDDPRLFQEYALSQWEGSIASVGSFLIDQNLYPDFAFRVVHARPNPGLITRGTRIKLISPRGTQKVTPHRFALRMKSDVQFSDIIAQEEAKEKCKIIQHYLAAPKKFGEWAPRCVLFHGPPGTGKTMTARALATEAGVPILGIKASELLGVYVGDGSRRIHRLYAESRRLAPCVVFIDELDVIALRRSFQGIRGDVVEVVSALLGELDGLSENNGVVTIAATNAADLLDPAIQSRFEQSIKFTMPTADERTQLLHIYADRSPVPIRANLRSLAMLTKDWSGRDLKEKLLKVAIHKALLSNKTEITRSMLEKLIETKDSSEVSPRHYS